MRRRSNYDWMLFLTSPIAFGLWPLSGFTKQTLQPGAAQQAAPGPDVAPRPDLCGPSRHK